MLTGEYYHNIDAKGRMIFPSKLRDELGEHFYVTRWMDDCLSVFSESEWDTICERIRQVPFSKSRDIQRYLFANATDVVPDKQGRILIPQNLRDSAHLMKDVTVIGVMNHAEIWDSERWREKSSSIDADLFDEKMQELDL